MTGLKEQGGRIAEVEAIDTTTGKRLTFRTGLVLLGAGALSSPHLILASGLAARNPAGHAIGGYLTRHCVAIVYGLFKSLPDEGRRSTSRWDSTMRAATGWTSGMAAGRWERSSRSRARRRAWSARGCPSTSTAGCRGS